MNDKRVKIDGESNEEQLPVLSVTYYETKEKKPNNLVAYDSTAAGFTNLYVKNFPRDDFDDADLIVS